MRKNIADRPPQGKDPDQSPKNGDSRQRAGSGIVAPAGLGDGAPAGVCAGYCPTGFQMITDVEIENYRCFEKVALKGCKRVNVIVGDNGSGKTALLEAIFMSAAPNPEIALRMRQWRGFDQVPLSGTQFSIEDGVFGELFHAFQKKRTIKIEIRGSKEQVRDLHINYRVRENWIQIRETNKKKSDKNLPAPITFEWTGPDRTRRKIPVNMTADGRFVVPVAHDIPVETSFFSSNQTYSSNETVRHFSKLSLEGRTGEIAAHLREEFNVEDFSVELSAGVPMVFVKVRDVPEKLALPVVSGALNRLMPIMCALVGNPKGAVLIDEIEDGFYYKKMESIWEALFQLAIKNDAQIFASTHSKECIAAAAKVAEKHPEDFALIKVAHGNGKSTLELHEGDDFVAAVEAGFDPRA